MRGVVRRALKKLRKVDPEQLVQLLETMYADTERMAVVLDSINEGVIVADTTGRVMWINKAAERMVPLTFGRNLRERPIFEVIADPDIATFVRDGLENEESIADREFTLDHNGQTRTLSCGLLPLVDDGQIRGTVLHLADVSERRLREAQLRRAESLASLTTLAAGVAHEIKNPLGSIGIHTQLVRKAVAQSPDSNLHDAADSFLDVIDEEIERLNRIVVDFLYAVRPMNVEFEDGDVGKLLQDLLAFVRYELDDAGVKLETEIDAELPAIRLDPRYLKQAFLNIVKNATAAMPTGGVLRVSCRRRGDQAVLRFSDTGEGMSDEVAAKIFEPYFTTKDFGSGLGLTLVYRVVKEHRGDISVTSRPGHGTTFSIALPVPQRELRLITWKREHGA